MGLIWESEGMFIAINQEFSIRYNFLRNNYNKLIDISNLFIIYLYNI